MRIFSPFFRSLDSQIEVVEKRIELRREALKRREDAVQEQLTATLTSPRAFGLAAALGFVLGRPEQRRGAAPARKGMFGWIAGVAFGLLQLRYGSPHLWVARALSRLAR